jgi:hypothetical protein
MASEIIVSINVQSGKAEVSLGKAKAGVDKLAAAKEKLADSETQLAKDIALVNLKTKEQIQVNNQAAAATLKNVNKGSGQFRTQVGLNNAILTEAGRAASDLRFGFNGVANNVGQIASLFGNLINTSDNVGTSLKNLAKSLMGTGGVMIAIQLLIAYGDRIYEFFVGSAKAIDVETDALIKNNAELDKSIAKRQILGEVIGETLDSFSSDFVINLMDGLNLLENTDLTLAEISERFSAIGVSNAKILKDETIANDARLEISFRLIDIFKEETKLKDLRRLQDEELLKGQKEGVEVNELKIKQFSVDIIQTRRRIKELNKDVETLTKRGVVITPDGNEGSGRDTREFKEKLFDIQRTIDKFNKEADKLNVRTLDERIDLEEKYAKISADSKLNRFIQTQSKRLEEYKEQVKDDKNAKELIKNAENDFNGSIVDAKIKHGLAIASIEEGFISKRILAKDKEAEKLGKIARKLENNEIDRLKFSLDANETFFNQKIKQAEGDKQDADDRILRAEQLKLSEVEIAQAKAQSIGLQNTLIDLNLAKEQAAADEKQRINTEYLGFVSGVGGILKTIAGENEALQTAALVLEKGAAIANIVIKTQAGNQAARALALANPIGVREAYMATTEAQVLRNNIGAGISIASILATSLTSAKSPSGGANGGGGANVTAPSFNVVGASATNQLAQTVAGQVNAPLRAYVVGSDISDQQELDRSIISTAGIG